MTNANPVNATTHENSATKAPNSNLALSLHVHSGIAHTETRTILGIDASRRVDSNTHGRLHARTSNAPKPAHKTDCCKLLHFIDARTVAKDFQCSILDFVYTDVYTDLVSSRKLAANVNPIISRGRKQKTIEPVFDSPPRVMASGDKVRAFKYRLSVSTNNMQANTQSVVVNVSTYPRRCYRRRTRTESNSTPTAIQQSIAKLREEKYAGWTYEMPIKLSVPEWSALRRLAASRNMTAAEFIQFHLDSAYVPLRVAIQQFEQKAAA